MVGKLRRCSGSASQAGVVFFIVLGGGGYLMKSAYAGRQAGRQRVADSRRG